MASEKELEAVGKLGNGKWILPVLLFEETKERYKDFLIQEHVQRTDVSEETLRSEKIYKDKTVEVFNTGLRTAGAVTIDNKHYGRYAGSLQIVKKRASG